MEKKDIDNAVKMVCPVCGIEYQADSQRLKYGRQTTCSRECSYVRRGQILDKKESFVCASCGKAIWKTPAQAAKVKHGSVFCSSACHYVGRILGHTKRTVTKPYSYTPEGKARMLAARCNRRKKRCGNVVRLTCQQCQGRFELLAWKRHNRTEYVFCSLDCCNKYRKGSNNPAWRGGHPDYYGPNWCALRRAARKRDNYHCRRCGKDMRPPHRAPDVHHLTPIVTFENRDEANTLDNVVCLCHNCHMYIEWHGRDFPL